MMVFVPNFIGVHGVRNGELIWKKEHKHKSASKCKWLFITKHISGYVSLNKNHKYEITIFCTKSGDLITVEELQTKKLNWHNSITARGQYVCYVKDSYFNLCIHVIKVAGENVTRHNFRLPYQKVFEQYGIRRALYYTEQSLLGFLGKSNILMFSLESNMGIKLYSFELDVAVSAKSYEDVKLAFSLPLASQEKNKFGHYFGHYVPIYQTDRINGSVDIVGAMLHKQEMGAVDAFYFFTEMQC